MKTKDIGISFVMIVAALFLSLGSAAAENRTDRAAIETVLKTYGRALNASNTNGIVALYTSDAVFMPQHSPSQVGKKAIRVAYQHVFKAIRFDIAFNVIEIKQLSDNWAFARTTSNGTVKIISTGNTGPEANQELFLLRKGEDGKWRIARYIFSTTNRRI